MSCDCIVMKSKDIEISIPKEIFNSVDKGIRVKLDDDGSFIIEKMQFESLRRINRKHLNNVLDKVNK
ncbi:TPA: hypothetical protein I9093_002915 [Clostridium perfringens]|nr:hypothetical protein CPBEC3_28230 [Clostridium perfringens]HAT4253564.1 hypothetical protein [Clostridium perfringens]HAT4271186.1 hypothetical protein [Clostridium perfringens]HCG3172725.1 hypothetical protein [Clostridium perfringens]